MGFFSKKVLSYLGVGAVVLATVYGCKTPRRTLSSEERKADMYWLYSQFGENYAPLEYKQTRYGFNYEELKKQYLEKAEAAKDNDDFYRVMHSFVAEFKDAHTSSSLTMSDLPQRTKIAYLGFFGVRKGDRLIVRELLPTIAENKGGFPIQEGDEILKIDGVDLKTAAAELVPYRSLGQDEANLTYHIPKLFLRISAMNGMPAKTEARLTIIHEGKEQEVVLPWVVKDYYAFAGEQKASAKASPYLNQLFPNNALFQPEDFFKVGFLRFDGKLDSASNILSHFLPNMPGFKFWNTFRFVDYVPAWVNGFEGVAPQAGARKMLSYYRNIPANALMIEESKTYPMYVSKEEGQSSDGKPKGKKKLVAYMFLYSFSPDAAQDEVVAELKASLIKLQAIGVEDLIIDMINNGGGSLTLGMELAQALSSTKVVMPEMQYRISETWLDEFESASLAGNDSERELYRRVFEQLRDEKAKGQRLSSKLNIETLLPYEYRPNANLDKKLNVVLLVNEMCASMCDIFTAILKDNNMAKVVGTKTMGAGGNVVTHLFAPNSGLIVNQTESLMLRRDGVTYIENNGIDPDVVVPVSLAIDSKYEPIRRTALAVLFGTEEVKK